MTQRCAEIAPVALDHEQRPVFENYQARTQAQALSGGSYGRFRRKSALLARRRRLHFLERQAIKRGIFCHCICGKIDPAKTRQFESRLA